MTTLFKSASSCVLAFVLMLCDTGIAKTIIGKVTDAAGSPLEGVSIVTNIEGVGGASAKGGIFIISYDDTIPVTHTSFSMIGYRPRIFAVTAVPPAVELETMIHPVSGIVVTDTRGEAGISPIAFDNVTQDNIKRDYTVGEFPLLLETTPNLQTFSDGGTPLGYSYVSIRGFDDKRVSTYINGVPLNDPEDQATYFVDLPDFASNVSDIQVQRGIGNSQFGDASFGGTLNVVTSAFNQERAVTLTTGYGGYYSGNDLVSDIYRQSISYNSGLIEGRWALGGRYSKQRTGGYRHGSWYDGWAYYFSIGRLDPNMTTELYMYGGPIRMHLSYWGISRDVLNADRRSNPLTYDNETDNFNQPHYHLHNSYRLNDNAILTNTLYYIRGVGYYEQYVSGALYSDYNILSSVTDSFVSGDLVRQNWVTKGQWGWNPSIMLSHSKGHHLLSGSVYRFASDHWGQVVWAQHVSQSLNPRHRYYHYDGRKIVASLSASELYRTSDLTTLQLAIQLRYQRYALDQTRMGAFTGYDYTVDWIMLSPRVGVSRKLSDKASVYASAALSSRTPTDAAIYDANDPHEFPSLQVEGVSVSPSGDTTFTFGDPTAKVERALDFEVGTQVADSIFSGKANMFWMEFYDEILPQGGVDVETGLRKTVNARRSVHSGIELSVSMSLRRNFRVSANASFNYNRLRDFTVNLDGYDVSFDNNVIPGFANYLANGIVDMTSHHWRLTYRLRLIGKQFLDYDNNDSLAIRPSAISSLSASRFFPNVAGVCDLTCTAKVDNLFQKRYEAGGYGGNYAYEDNSAIIVGGWAEYYPAAERSFFLQMSATMF